MITHYEYRQSTVSIYQQTKRGQHTCGDMYFVTETDSYLLVAIADGLGSGRKARESADILLQYVEQNHQRFEVDELIVQANAQVRGTRGSVIGIMKMHYSTNLVDYVGVGNIQMYIANKAIRLQRSISKPGYLAGRPIRVRKYDFEWHKGSVFVIHSDGADMRITNEEKQQLVHAPQQWLTSNGRHRCTDDDATIIVGFRRSSD